jgi:hypothetical protein
MDLSPRRSGMTPAAPAGPGPKTAAALHTRAKPSHIIDLRPSGTVTTSHTPTIDHQSNRTPAAAPKSTTHERHIAQFTDRFDRAKKYGRSEYVSRFGPKSEDLYDKFGNKTLAGLESPEAAAPAAPAHHNSEHHAALAPASSMPQMSQHAITQHAAMARLAPANPAPGPAPSTWKPGLSVSPRGGRILATATAVAIMAGYVWVQNYPKLAIQSANGRAGISASLPGFVPSSYSLKHTQTDPGLVTLSFASPSSPETLTIAQHRTTWDSSSLLDNFVSKQADDYATVQGQGLTIYLWGNNQASWVNHGIWYSIEGASRLSREQILKMAYSL